MRKLVGAALAAAVVVLSPASQRTLGQAPPNIVVIMTDDLDQAALATMVQAGLMPGFSSVFVENGAAFTESFVVTARGCPSRTTFLTGQYFHTHGRSDGRCGVSAFIDGSLLPNWLHDAGYRTSLIGRYVDGYGYTDITRDGVVDRRDQVYIPPGWDNWEAFVFPQILDTHPPEYASAVWWENANMYGYYVNTNGSIARAGTTAAEYQTDAVARRAARYIQGAPATSPFFLMLAPTAPHVEVFPEPTTVDEPADAWRWSIKPAPRHAGTVTLPLPQPPSFNEADMSDKPEWLAARPSLTSLDVVSLTRQYQNRLASLRAVDSLIAAVMNALQNTGRLNRTVLIFTSDNGWFYGEHRLSSKLAAFEEAIKVPLYISGFGPKTIAGLVTNIDLAPTIAELAGLTPPASVDGTSLVPLLGDPGRPWRKRFLVESWAVVANPLAEPGPFEVPTYDAVRTGPGDPDAPLSTYVEYEDGAVEFYDRATDPAQVSSLGADPSPLRVQQRLILEKWRAALSACAGAMCRELEFR